jgi:large subunit ribosomal protein L4
VSTVTVVTPSGQAGTDVELPEQIFGAKVNIPLIHQVVVAQQAAARQGTHATKTRGMVRGGGKKSYRQKGTGRARQGSLRAPQYAGGGTVHGPVPRSYRQRTPKKMKAAALRGALSDRAGHGRLSVVSAFVTGEQPSTREALALLRTVVGETGSRLSRAVLVVATAGDALTRKSLRNAPGVRVLVTGQLNTYDVLASDHVVFTEAALAEFVGGGLAGSPAGGPEATATAAAEAEADASAPAEPASANTASAGTAPAETAPAETGASAAGEAEGSVPAEAEASAPDQTEAGVPGETQAGAPDEEEQE